MEREQVTSIGQTADLSSIKSVSKKWRLPPLILHPFAGDKGPDRLMEGSRAQLALHGLLPGLHASREEMERSVTDGRYQEFKMLIYIGRDLQRWAEQCVDFARREPGLSGEGFAEQSFVAMLVNRPPDNFAEKMKKWGITDQRTIFTRAIGLHSVFDQPPDKDQLNDRFLHSYQRYADYLFICYQTMTQYKSLEGDVFALELYASEEYANLLAAGWTS